MTPLSRSGTPFFDEEPHLIAMDNAVRNAILETIEACAMVAQCFRTDPRFEESDPRIFALHNQAIADEIRRMAK